MHIGGSKKTQNPIPPEYANVWLLKLITICVGLICLLITSYATWTIYLLTDHLSNYETTLDASTLSLRKITPIDFELFDRTSAIDKQKQSFNLTPVGWDMFYSRMITSTAEATFQEYPTSTPTSSTPKL